MTWKLLVLPCPQLIFLMKRNVASLKLLNALVLINREYEEEDVPHLLVDLHLGVLNVGPVRNEVLQATLEALLEAFLSEGVEQEVVKG